MNSHKMFNVAQRWSKVERATAPRFVVLLHLLHLLHPPIGVAGGGGATNPSAKCAMTRSIVCKSLVSMTFHASRQLSKISIADDMRRVALRDTESRRPPR
jgi:hypothetical protein